MSNSVLKICPSACCQHDFPLGKAAYWTAKNHHRLWEMVNRGGRARGERALFSWAALQAVQLHLSGSKWLPPFLVRFSSHNKRSSVDFWLSSRTASRLNKCNVAFHYFVWLLLPKSTSLLLEIAIGTALFWAKGKRSASTDTLPGIKISKYQRRCRVCTSKWI